MDDRQPTMGFPKQILKQKHFLKNMLKRPHELSSSGFLNDSFDFIKNCEVVESGARLSDKYGESRVFTNSICLRNDEAIRFKNNLKKLFFLLWHEGNKHSKKKSQSTTFCWISSSHISMLFGGFKDNIDQRMQSTNYYGSFLECRMTIQHEYQSSWLSSPMTLSSLLLPFLLYHKEDKQEKESHSTVFYWSNSSHIDQYVQSTNYCGSLFECWMAIQHEYDWMTSPMTFSSQLLPTTDKKHVDSHTANTIRGRQKHVIATNEESLSSENKVKQTTSRKFISQTTQEKRKFEPSQKDVELKNVVNADINNQQPLFWSQCLAFILVVFGSFPATDASRINFPPKDTYPAKVLSAKILFSETCEYQNFSCPTEARNIPLLMKHCGFTDICPPGHKPICVNAGEQAVIICSESNLTCDAGFHRTAVRDNDKKDMVVIFEEGCPVGKYQPTPSDCYNACYSQHRTFLPERYLIYTTGDNVNPTFVFCNYNIGYVNREGNLQINFDEEEEHDQYFCQLVNKSAYCNGKHDMFPLPNGTCVSACSNGEFRDDFDDFKCKQINSKANEATTAIFLSTDIVQKASSYVSPTAPGSPAERDRRKDHADDPNSTKTNENTTIYAVCSVIGVIAAGSVILGTCIHKIKTGKWFWQTTCCSEGYREVRTNKRIKKNCTTNNFYGDFTITMGTDVMKIERSDGTDESFSSIDPNESLLSDESGTNRESTGSEQLDNNSGEMQEVDLSTTVTVETETDETLSKEIHSEMPLQLQDRSKPTATVPPFEPQNSSTNMMELKV